MVYFGIVAQTVTIVAEQLTFTSKREFPVSIGDTVYIGYTPTASKTAHLVTNVNYESLQVTIEAHDVVHD